MRVTCQPALMTGPYDWDPANIPLADYHARLAAARALVPDGPLLVVGDRGAFGALAWLTGFTPKLGPALALFPVGGVPRLWFSGGPGMVGSARRLTWIEDVSALAAPARDLAALSGQRVALWGESAISASLYDAVASVAGALVSVDAALDPLRRAVSPREQALLDRGSAILAAVAARLCADLAAGTGLGEAVVAAERLGYGMGAQDIRVLASRRPGGPPLPIDDRMAGSIGVPALVSVSVRHSLLWSESTVPIR